MVGPGQGASVLHDLVTTSRSCQPEELGEAPCGGCTCLTHVHMPAHTCPCAHSCACTHVLLCKDRENVKGWRSAQRVSA